MAWAQVSCTDWIDMLRKMTLFATGGVNAATAGGAWLGGSGVVGSTDVWTQLTNGGSQPSLPGSGTATDGELYLQGQGSDPTDQIIIGFKTYRNVGNNVYGIQTMGYTAFNNTLTFLTMPGYTQNVSGVATPTASAWSISSYNAWFWVNSRRIMIAARIGTYDVFMYMGFVLQYGSRSQYPYPLLISGTTQDTTYNESQNNFGASSMPDPCPNGAYFRWVDGTWQLIQHYSSNSPTRGQASTFSNTYQFWPLRDVSVVTDSSEAGTTYNEDDLFRSFSSTNHQISSSEIGSYPLFPLILHSSQSLVGQLDGVYMVPGLGLTPGDTISDGTYTYDVFHNTYRAEVVDYFVVRRV